MVKPLPGIQLEHQSSDFLIVACLWAEARGEGYIGMLAVLYVLANRVKRRGSSFPKEILKPWQFSSFNDNDPNRDKMLDAWKEDPAGWTLACEVLSDYQAGHTQDPTAGADHYCTHVLWDVDDSARIADGRLPRWHSHQEIEAGHTVLTATIKNHVFARAA